MFLPAVGPPDCLFPVEPFVSRSVLDALDVSYFDYHHFGIFGLVVEALLLGVLSIYSKRHAGLFVLLDRASVLDIFFC